MSLRPYKLFLVMVFNVIDLNQFKQNSPQYVTTTTVHFIAGSLEPANSSILAVRKHF